ncbi:MAG: L-lactate dehydrogenase [Armatimonadota bacterium]|nr:L-lactate dehydrogenase [bacterium]MCS7308947.1 L-lactate dehydrogenase [Armatimonadota bacterium]MDW8104996.1 L-lactate dehydrogenase [Armatimonadota bacterium]MDW8291326.1 L-lactate dehydrogenase [Armatimonadota bacterium]
MKVSIVGGGGRVGSNTLYALQLGGVVKELAVIDVARELAEGEALDLRHGAALSAPQKIYAGGTDAAAGSDIVIITAGLRRKPDESRLELINRNVSLFRSILQELRGVSLPEHAILLVVSNPVDILTYLAVKEFTLPPQQVIGLGTVLDTTRFRSLLAEHFGIAATDVKALILGEHGDSMVPIWSTANANGVPLQGLPGYDPAKMEEIFDFTKRSGAEVIRLKGGAGYAVGVAIREVVHAILLDRQQILPVSSLLTGLYGIEDVCLSVPTIIGRKGVIQQIEMQLSDNELQALRRSAEVLKETLAQVMA